MICYKDRWWCNKWKSCDKGIACDRAFTKKEKELAEKWMKYPMIDFIEAPECYNPKK